MPDDTDREILERFVRGDEDAFESLFRQFERDVYTWILRIVRDVGAAEDAVVETFWRAYRGRARFDPSRNLGPWLRRIATNTALDYLKAAQRHPQPLDRDVAEPATAPASDGLAESIHRAFGKLSPKLQVVATLALVEGHSYAEIADALGVPVGTVKSRVFRATNALQAELARLGIRL